MEERRGKPACRLVGEDGNVFSVIARVRQALRDAGEREQAREFVEGALACHSYDQVLRLAMEYVEVE